MPNFPLSPAEASANGKGSLDPDRIVEGDIKDIYPSTPILVTLTVALMMAIFMIGLDTNIIGKFIHFKGPLESRGVSAAASCRKENIEPMTTTRDRHPKNYEPFPQLERCRLVRVRIFVDPTVIAINVRKTILTLQHQMGLHRGASDL